MLRRLLAVALPMAVPAALAVPEGTDTRSSVRAAALAMRERARGSAVVVTDPWHSLRARTTARDEGLGAVASPVPDGPVEGSGTAVRCVVRETAGQLAHLVSTRVPGL